MAKVHYIIGQLLLIRQTICKLIDTSLLQSIVPGLEKNKSFLKYMCMTIAYLNVTLYVLLGSLCMW